jgi:hypothetical protein
MKINEDKCIEPICKLHDDATQRAMRPDLVWESTNEDGKNCWQSTEITCPWSWVDHDGETLQKEYNNRVGKYDQLRREIAEAYPERPVNQFTIVVNQFTSVRAITNGVRASDQTRGYKVGEVQPRCGRRGYQGIV